MIQVKYINSFGRKEVYDDWLPLGYIPTRLYYIHSGNCSFAHKGKKIMLEPGYLYLIPFTVAFDPYSDKNNPLDHSYVDFEIIPPIISQDIYRLNPETEMDSLTKSACDMFLQIVGSKKNTIYLPPDAEDETSELLNSVISFLVKQFANLLDIQMPKDKLAISIMNELIDNMGIDITINDLAKKYYMSPDAIIRRFKKCFDITPYAYLKELRLRMAAHMIQSGEKLSDAAQATNYTSASSLLHAISNKRKHSDNIRKIRTTGEKS